MKKKFNWKVMVCLAVVAILLATYSTTTFARYVSTKSGDSSSLDSSSFYITSNLDVRESGDTSISTSVIDFETTMVEIESGFDDIGGKFAYVIAEKEFSVQNYQDDASATNVDVEYTVSIDTTGNIPFVYAIQSISGDGGIQNSYVLSGAFESSGDFEAGTGEVHSYKITVYWLEEDIDAEYASMVEYAEINVSAVQAIG